MIPLLQQGMLRNRKRRVLLPSACHLAGMCMGTLGAPRLATCLIRHWSLPFVQASAALPMGPHVAGDSHLVW